MSTPTTPLSQSRTRTPADRTCALLAAHVPISLLLDLADPGGPHSRELLADEPGSADWLSPA